MRFDIEKVVAFIHVFFSVIFLIHISAIGYNILYPEVPEIVVYKRNLNDVHFPMIFRICAFELYDTVSRYQSFGYDTYQDFFRGMSMFNNTLYGWAGHDEEGSIVGNVEGKMLNLIFSSASPSPKSLRVQADASKVSILLFPT